MKHSINPVIGITSSIVNHNNIKSVNLHERFIRSVTQAGGIPIIIPTGTEEMPKLWVSNCDGIILSSGEDVDPNSYRANPDPRIQMTNEKRDKTEIGLVEHALKQKKPILATCRGATMLNVALGGTVIQDIESNNPNAINHYQQAARPEPTHEVQIENNSWLYEILNNTTYRVNSIHHQAIGKIASGLRIVAVAPDGVIEAVEGTGEYTKLLLGVQWHPEEMASEDSNMQNLFKAFVGECINTV
ncbi:putative glutamine amidotransferase [Virgibacillus subterraneus]|uniref:Glutamine amidotransferase n=1 Tax=Virgibacillus subterraneus TaxID=621109 RepID=A0A1H9K895_9BACI|nr:gamma-glutamyl-gamma-aminobutyrate hydrolase family protein [Virgibacillus subterraneus]SEQ95446.1 putative glutamine amidotransferase [Virgibacillus subterraneus]